MPFLQLQIAATCQHDAQEGESCLSSGNGITMSVKTDDPRICGIKQRACFTLINLHCCSLLKDHLLKCDAFLSSNDALDTKDKEVLAARALLHCKRMFPLLPDAAKESLADIWPDEPQFTLSTSTSNESASVMHLPPSQSPTGMSQLKSSAFEGKRKEIETDEFLGMNEGMLDDEIELRQKKVQALQETCHGLDQVSSFVQLPRENGILSLISLAI